MTHAINQIISTAPATIYLDLPQEVGFWEQKESNFKDFFEVTWSEDCATGVGIPYVRADLVPTPAASGAAPLTARKLTAEIKAACREKPTALNGYGLKLWERIETQIAAALASREASPAPLTDERIGELWIEHGLDECAPEGFARIIEREVLAAPASPQVAPAPVPDGFALVPIRMTKAMEYVTEQEEWHWGDLLAAAEAVDEDTENWYRKAEEAIYDMELDGCIWHDGEWHPPIPRVATPVQVAPTPTDDQMREALWFAMDMTNVIGRTRANLIEYFLHKINKDRLAAPVAPQDDARDAARLDFLIEREAFVTASKTRIDPTLKYQCWSRDEDEDYRYLSGEHEHFDTAREAIDAAIVLSTPAAKPTEPTLPTQGDAK